MGDDARSDRELVGAVKGGDWGAFDVIYFRYKEWVHGLAWRFCGEEADAADVVQEVFVYLARKLGEGGFELRAEMKTFLYPAVKHTAVALRKKRRRFVGGEEAEWEGIAREKEGESGDIRGELREVLGGLSAAHREVLLMRFVDDMSLEEIGVALGVPVGTVKSRLHHAVGAVRGNERIVRWLGGG